MIGDFLVAMATARLRNPAGVHLLPRNKCLVESFNRSSRLPFLPKLVGLNPLRVARRIAKQGVVTRAAYTGREAVIDHGYDVYELLGVEADAAVPEIKQAYRWLQKRCHPDIAGPIGHDMAILLNDAYATLSNPTLRAIYDVKRMERAAFDGYTGKPLYSKWLGPAEEDRAIFVDESQCVGCLKCALIASNTFAIENRYGRARAVGQWGDSEATVTDAIKACPVDCISFVDRKQLPALEFVMTKQPRVIVGVDMQTYGGQRNENVFVAAEKFLKKCAERERARGSNLPETEAQKEARMEAAENIQARAGRWWHHFVGKEVFSHTETDTVRTSRGAIVPMSWIDQDPSPKQPHIATEQLHALLEAARRRRQGKGLPIEEDSAPTLEDEYWTPLEPSSTTVPYDEQQPVFTRRRKVTGSSGIAEVQMDQVLSGWVKSLLSTAPVAVSLLAAVFAGMSAAESSEILVSDATSGPLPAEVTSHLFMHMFLAAVVWYMLAAAVSAVAAFLIASVVVMRRDKH